jgi:hypothetical protein
MNPPGYNESSNNFTTMKNGVVLIMNQSQRDYYKMNAGVHKEQNGIKLISMAGNPSSDTKQKVLNLIQNDRGIASRHGKGKMAISSRQSTNRKDIGSR